MLAYDADIGAANKNRKTVAIYVIDYRPKNSKYTLTQNKMKLDTRFTALQQDKCPFYLP